jgi:glutamine synthetase
VSQTSEKLGESCREAIDIVVTSCIRYKAIVKEKLADAYIAIKSGDLKKAEEIVKDLLIFLDI